MRRLLGAIATGLAVFIVASVALAVGSNRQLSFVQATDGGSNGSLDWPEEKPWTEVQDRGSRVSGKVQGRDEMTWPTPDPYVLVLNEGLSSRSDDSFQVRYALSGVLKGDVHVDYVELVGTLDTTPTLLTTTTTLPPLPTTTTLPVGTTLPTVTTTTLPPLLTTTTLPVGTTLPTVTTTTLPPLLTTTTLPVGTTLPTVTTTTLPPLLTTTSSSTTTTAEGTTTTAVDSSGTTATSSGSGPGDEGDGEPSRQTAPTSTSVTEETSTQDEDDDSTAISPVEPPEDPGLRQASTGLQVGYQDGRMGEIASSPDLMSVSIEPGYTMAAEIFGLSWPYLLVLLLIIATALVTGIDRRRLNKAKHSSFTRHIG